MKEETKTRALRWMTTDFDKETRAEVERLMDQSPALIEESFYKDLDFGTGGLRGIMGVGTNRINIYTVAYATQGLAAYVKKSFPHLEQPSVAIAYDSRNNSPLFAKRAAEVLAANGIKAYLYTDLRPTPVLSFAVRELACQAGIVITASHNPKEYNGYKVYWEDGGQLVPPHDKGVIEEVRQVKSPSQVQSTSSSDLIVPMGREMDETYLSAISGITELPVDHIGKKQVKICFTSLHGTGITMIPQALENAGFEHIHLVEEQSRPDGDFPSVDSPNPEERSAMAMALEEAQKVGSDIVFGTDPDADRVGMAVRDDLGELILLNGNEAAALLITFLLTMKEEKGDRREGDYIAKTVVTTDLLRDIADAFGVHCHETLTGFKYIAELIREKEGRFIGGGEESYGYLIGDVVRDKDAVISTVMLAEMAAWTSSDSKTPYHLLKEIRLRHGFYKEELVSLVKQGMSGAEEIERIMSTLRNAPPTEIAGSKVVRLTDHQRQIETDVRTTEEKPTGLPSSNVLQFHLEDGSKVTARPSGTEPKIKYYISVKLPLGDIAEHDEVAAQADGRIADLEKALGVPSSI